MSRVDELAEKFVTSEISYGGLEHIVGGEWHEDCVKSYKAGYQAALAESAKCSNDGNVAESTELKSELSQFDEDTAREMIQRLAAVEFGRTGKRKHSATPFDIEIARWQFERDKAALIEQKELTAFYSEQRDMRQAEMLELGAKLAEAEAKLAKAKETLNSAYKHCTFSGEGHKELGERIRSTLKELE